MAKIRLNIHYNLIIIVEAVSHARPKYISRILPRLKSFFIHHFSHFMVYQYYIERGDANRLEDYILKGG